MIDYSIQIGDYLVCINNDISLNRKFTIGFKYEVLYLSYYDFCIEDDDGVICFISVNRIFDKYLISDEANKYFVKHVIYRESIIDEILE